MYYSVPNQRVVCVHRERATSDFLGIKNENWQAAARDLGPYALELYLYFAANANGYQMAFSPTAVNDAIGMPASTARDQFKKLIAKGYLIPVNGNGFDFFEISQTRAVSQISQGNESRSPEATSSNFEKESPTSNLEFDNIEINNTDISTNKLNNGRCSVTVKPSGGLPERVCHEKISP